MKLEPEHELIERHVDLETDRYAGGRADARPLESDVFVGAIVAFLSVHENDVARVADHFSI